MVPPVVSLGQVAFQAYSDTQSGKTHDGKTIPPWSKLGETIQSAWEEAAKAAVRASTDLGNHERRAILGE